MLRRMSAKSLRLSSSSTLECAASPPLLQPNAARPNNDSTARLSTTDRCLPPAILHRHITVLVIYFLQHIPPQLTLFLCSHKNMREPRQQERRRSRRIRIGQPLKVRPSDPHDVPLRRPPPPKTFPATAFTSFPKTKHIVRACASSLRFPITSPAILMMWSTSARSPVSKFCPTATLASASNSSLPSTQTRPSPPPPSSNPTKFLFLFYFPLSSPRRSLCPLCSYLCDRRLPRPGRGVIVPPLRAFGGTVTPVYPESRRACALGFSFSVNSAPSVLEGAPPFALREGWVLTFQRLDPSSLLPASR